MLAFDPYTSYSIYPIQTPINVLIWNVLGSFSPIYFLFANYLYFQSDLSQSEIPKLPKLEPSLPLPFFCLYLSTKRTFSKAKQKDKELQRKKETTHLSSSRTQFVITLTQHFGINKTTTSAYHLQSNGFIERHIETQDHFTTVTVNNAPSKL